VGCTIVEMATGQPPFGDMDFADVFCKVGSGEAPPIPSHLPEDLKDFISQCLEVDGAKTLTCDMLLTHPFLDD
jgi:mitogen-activated protein kinase kinase kinase 1